MKLLEFLTKIDAYVEPKMIRVPMWALEGSDADYRAYLHGIDMRQPLTEAAIDRYKPMIQFFGKLDQLVAEAGGETLMHEYGGPYLPKAMQELQWCVDTMRRQDRISYYMRYWVVVKLDRIVRGMTAHPDVFPAELINVFETEFNKRAGKLGVDTNSIYWMENLSFFNHERMEHYLSYPDQEFQSIVWDKQTPEQLMNQYDKVEAAWQARRKQVLNYDEEENQPTVIIQFPDGSQWVNLDRSSCSREGDAMGHCGNTASNQRYERVLSYRTPVTKDGHPTKDITTRFWRPRLTFILDTRDGYLGEMKGRANNKPKEELHPYIVELLKQDFIKGIRGGGYKPEANFEMDDLDEQTREALVNIKPSLGTLMQHFNAEGWDGVKPRVIDLLTDNFNEEYIPGVGFPVDSYSSLDRFIEYGNIDDTTKYAIKNMENGLHHMGGLADVSNVVELMEEYFQAHPDDKAKLDRYLQSAYAEEIEEDDLDLDDYRVVARLLKDQDDAIWHTFSYGVDDAYRVGAESEMDEAITEFFNDPISDPSYLKLTDGKGNDYTPWDSSGSIYVLVPEGKAMLELAVEIEEHDADYYGSYELEIEWNNVDEPRYGWSGYDSDAGVETVANDLVIPEPSQSSEDDE